MAVRDKWPGSAPWTTQDGRLSGPAARWLLREFETVTGADAVTSVVTPFALTLLDDANATAAKATLGIGSLADQAFDNVSITGGSITGITDLAVTDGGTGASNAGDARANLGLGSIATQDASSVTITGGTIAGITTLGASGVVLTSGSIDGVSIGQVSSNVGTFTDLVAVNYVRTTATTVAGLPAASSAGAGARSFVTDATATTFLSTVAGGGGNAVPVVSDGTNWLIG